MSPKTANYGLLLFDALALLGFYILFQEHFLVVSQIDSHSERIIFDTGLYYLLLFSVFPLVRIVQMVALIAKTKEFHWNLDLLFIVWFILCLVLANAIPYKMQKDLIATGYQYCGRMESYRVARGSRNIYQFSECK